LTNEGMTRRLAAILSVDVVGYSRLMGRDENGTLARFKGHLTERLEPTLARHGGRLVKLTGDGALVEFTSAVGALGAAVEFQQAMAEANRDQATDAAMVFRIGVHLGDRIVEDDDIYGDDVNIAVGSRPRRRPAESLFRERFTRQWLDDSRPRSRTWGVWHSRISNVRFRHFESHGSPQIGRLPGERRPRTQCRLMGRRRCPTNHRLPCCPFRT